MLLEEKVEAETVVEAVMVDLEEVLCIYMVVMVVEGINLVVEGVCTEELVVSGEEEGEHSGDLEGKEATIVVEAAQAVNKAEMVGHMVEGAELQRIIQ